DQELQRLVEMYMGNAAAPVTIERGRPKIIETEALGRPVFDRRQMLWNLAGKKLLWRAVALDHALEHGDLLTLVQYAFVCRAFHGRQRGELALDIADRQPSGIVGRHGTQQQPKVVELVGGDVVRLRGRKQHLVGARPE